MGVRALVSRFLSSRPSVTVSPRQRSMLWPGPPQSDACPRVAYPRPLWRGKHKHA